MRCLSCDCDIGAPEIFFEFFGLDDGVLCHSILCFSCWCRATRFGAMDGQLLLRVRL